MLSKRYSHITTILLLYLLPMLLVSLYGKEMLPKSKSWTLFSLGLAASFFGASAFYIMLSRWELKHFTPVAKPTTPKIEPVKEIHSSTEPSEEELTLRSRVDELTQEEGKLKEELKKLETNLELSKEKVNEFQHHVQLVEEELHRYKETVEHQDQEIQEFQKESNKQKILLENQRNQIAGLQTREQDLRYELKTLLKVVNLDSLSSSAPTDSKTALPNHEIPLLNKLIQQASRMTGNSLTGPNSPLDQKLSVDNQGLELRRLYDLLQAEAGSALIFVSPQDKKLLFANHVIRELTGWSPDQFIENFNEIVKEDQEAWSSALDDSIAEQQCSLHLSFTHKNGSVAPLKCSFGKIQRGAFRGYLLGQLEPSLKG